VGKHPHVHLRATCARRNGGLRPGVRSHIAQPYRLGVLRQGFQNPRLAPIHAHQLYVYLNPVLMHLHPHGIPSYLFDGCPNLPLGGVGKIPISNVNRAQFGQTPKFSPAHTEKLTQPRNSFVSICFYGK
jgi:hypothetical protein